MRAKARGAATGHAGECRCGVREGGVEGSWGRGAVAAAAAVGVVEEGQRRCRFGCGVRWGDGGGNVVVGGGGERGRSLVSIEGSEKGVEIRGGGFEGGGIASRWEELLLRD